MGKQWSGSVYDIIAQNVGDQVKKGGSSGGAAGASGAVSQYLSKNASTIDANVKAYENYYNNERKSHKEENGFYGHTKPSQFKRTNQIKSTGKGAL